MRGTRMSFHENTEELVNGVCMLEYSHAVGKWVDTFHSLHERWAVLKEEVEEVECEFADLKSDFEHIWYSVIMDNRDGVISCADYIQKSAIRAMKELAQVWAVCEKMKKTAKKEE